ncbi:MarR family winged helix-turn-helix transcriptional regulator [Solimonas variicoloris]|uniref:MarR family winged helix-turn-helix transcriptional regulator n=1 Tax=Solimonas variicoloris TaxID=254408 RepID=UPI00035C3FA7|nr:MarR family transcriptional regulator [Solimonas variicoloris]
MKPAQRDAERIWQILVALVMESRGDWRRKAAEATGLPFSRVRALRRLKDQDRSLRDLAWEMGTDAPAATVIINDLEERGLVERRAHPEDRRSKLVSLTAEGRKRVAALRKIADEPPPSLASLPAEDLAQLLRILERVGGAG